MLDRTVPGPSDHDHDGRQDLDMAIDPRLLRQQMEQAAAAEGFNGFGITPAVSLTGFDNLVRWLEAGYAGQMHYFADRLEAYRHPASVLAGVRSLIVLTFPYPNDESSQIAAGEGRLARYIGDGPDYHDWIHPKLKRLCQLLTQTSEQTTARGVIDTAPLMEREVAQLAGIGWTGKNTLLLNQQSGSYFFLACVLTNLELPYDQPHHAEHCGTCTACLDACPTDAFPQAGVLDATRCISYLTIEHREAIPLELRDGVGDWLFGCDVCQEVCPWNQKARKRTATVDPARLDRLPLPELFSLDEETFRKRFRKTPLWRTRRRGILRNAAIVLGNQRDRSAVTALSRGLQDPEEMVRGASAWALGKIATAEAITRLEQRLLSETSQQVQTEIRNALATP